MLIRGALLALCLLTIVNLPAGAETFDGRRAVIIDGDTFALGSEREAQPIAQAVDYGRMAGQED